MESSQRALQTNGKNFIKFQFRFRIANWLKTEKYSNRVNIDQAAIYYVSNIRLDKLYKLLESFFFNFRNHFPNYLQFFETIVALGLCKRDGGRHLC